MSTEQNNTIGMSDTHTPIKRPNEPANYCTILLNDLQSFVPVVNHLVSTENKVNQINSLAELTTSLTNDKLNLINTDVELNPVLGSISSVIVNLDSTSTALGFRSITINTKPLEDLIIPQLTPSMITESSDGGYVITKSNDEFCGINQIEIQDIALASNIEYTITMDDLTLSSEYVGETLRSYYKKSFDFTKNSSDIFINTDTGEAVSFVDSNNKATVFGVKNLTVNIPLVESHEFVVNAQTVDHTYIPADVPPNADGTGGHAGKVGFKRVILRAVTKADLTATKIIDCAHSQAKDVNLSSNHYTTFVAASEDDETSDGVTGTGVGYKAVNIPPIKSFATDAKNHFSTDNRTISWNTISNLMPSCLGIDTLYIKKSGIASPIIEPNRDQFINGTNSIFNKLYSTNDPKLKMDFVSGKYSVGTSYYNSNILNLDYKLLTNLTIPIPATVNAEISYLDYLQAKQADSAVTLKTFIQEKYPLPQNSNIYYSDVTINELPISDLAITINPDDNASIVEGASSSAIKILQCNSAGSYTISNNNGSISNTLYTSYPGVKEEDQVKNTFLDFKVEFIKSNSYNSEYYIGICNLTNDSSILVLPKSVKQINLVNLDSGNQYQGYKVFCGETGELPLFTIVNPNEENLLIDYCTSFTQDKNIGWKQVTTKDKEYSFAPTPNNLYVYGFTLFKISKK